MLQLESLAKSIAALERALRVAGTAGFDAETLETIRAGAIQSFEVAYEQCWKTIQRWIRENRSPEDADHPRTRKELFRLAAEYGLVPDATPWFAYGDARNLTAHVYDEARADEVFRAARAFAADARVLLARLESAND